MEPETNTKGSKVTNLHPPEVPASGQSHRGNPIVFGPSGPGGGGDMLEARVARLESDVEYIKRDVAEIRSDVKDLSGKVGTINTRLAYATGAILAGAALIGMAISAAAYIITNNFQIALEVIDKAQ